MQFQTIANLQMMSDTDVIVGIHHTSDKWTFLKNWLHFLNNSNPDKNYRNPLQKVKIGNLDFTSKTTSKKLLLKQPTNNSHKNTTRKTQPIDST